MAQKRRVDAYLALQIIAKRLQHRADILQGVGLPAFKPAILELRRFAEMTRKAIEHVQAHTPPGRNK